MININEFMNEYSSKNHSFIKAKNTVLEVFRTKEEQIRSYDEILSELVKTNASTKIDSFENIKEKVFNFLLEFDTDNIQENTKKVESVIAFLLSKENELKKLSEVFTFIKKTWIAFLKRRNENDKEALFMNEINEKIQSLHENFYTSGIDDIGRLEQLADDLKQEVLKVINLFEELYVLLENNVFIGKEALLLKKDIEEFLEKDFYESSTIELLKRKEKISFDIKEILQNETKYEKVSIPVVKVSRKDKRDYFFYTLKFDNYLLEFQNEKIDPNLAFIEHTDKVVYIDNYPTIGIFKIEDIKEKMIISYSHFETMLDFDSSSGKLFYGLSSVFMVSTLLSIFNVINIFMLIFIASVLSAVFYFSFKAMLLKITNKYKTKDAFFFIPTNYYFLKEGDLNFNYKDLIFTILLRADNTILKEK